MSTEPTEPTAVPGDEATALAPACGPAVSGADMPLAAQRLRARIAALEVERIESLARAHDQLAAAQDRGYWLDRWRIDLNGLMHKRGGHLVRRGARLAHNLQVLRARVTHAAGLTVREYRAGANDSPGPPAGGTGPAAERGFERSLPPALLHAAPVTDVLWERLAPEDVARVEQLAAAELGPLTAHAPDDVRRVALSLGVAADAGDVRAATGLTAAAPPADVHSMGRGPLAAGGSAYYADLVVEGLAAAGQAPAAAGRWLDLGCSSGRIVRVLAAAYPEVEWHGCDPIGGAVEWAGEHIPAVAFTRSPERPPLPYGDGYFDAVFAISIWSHHSAPAALAWLGEAARVVRPGGALLLSTHGAHSVRRAAEQGTLPPEQLAEIRAALYEHGHWFRDEFGPGGDHGVGGGDWGTAFLSPEWLLARLGDDWRLADFAPGRVESDQDCYVLSRR